MPISFVIGIDDDDAKPNDYGGFEVQTWWPVTKRVSGWTLEQAYFYASDEIEEGIHITDFGGFVSRNQF